MAGTRTIHGVKVYDEPRGARKFASEASRWRIIAEGLKEAANCCERVERGLYATLIEAYAYAESRRRALLQESERDQLDLDFCEAPVVGAG